MLTLTPKAVEKIQAIQRAEAVAAELALRVEVVGGGCSGLRYDLYFDAARADDETIDCGGVKLVVDPTSLASLRGTEIDYVETLEAAGFKFANPNATQKCGCGQSFCA